MAASSLLARDAAIALREVATLSLQGTARAPSRSPGSDGWAITLIACLAAVGLGAVIGSRIARTRDRRTPVAYDGTDERDRLRRPVGEDEVPSAPWGAASRTALVEACIQVRTMASDPSIREIMDDALAKGGVEEIVPTGQRFDPRRHNAVGVMPTDDPQKDSVIAGTDRPGYQDQGRLIVPPDVVVHRYEAAR